MRPWTRVLFATASLAVSLGASACIIRHNDPGYYGYCTRPHSYHREVRYRDDGNRDRHRDHYDDRRWDRDRDRDDD